MTIIKTFPEDEKRDVLISQTIELATSLENWPVWFELFDTFEEIYKKGKVAFHRVLLRFSF